MDEFDGELDWVPGWTPSDPVVMLAPFGVPLRAGSGIGSCSDRITEMGSAVVAGGASESAVGAENKNLLFIISNIFRGTKRRCL